MKWYKYDIKDLSDTEYEKWYSLMSEDKKRRVDSFKLIDDKKRTVAGEMLARNSIAEWCAVPPESLNFGIGEHGKPYVKSLAVEFNVSHCDNMVVCAVCDTPVGIDIQRIKPVNLKIAKRICNDKELETLFGYTPTDKDFIYCENEETLKRFFCLWTEKEACVKYTGNGLADIKKTIVKSAENCFFEDYCVSVMY